jgi:hypothetical protein
VLRFTIDRYSLFGLRYENHRYLQIKFVLGLLTLLQTPLLRV